MNYDTGVANNFFTTPSHIRGTHTVSARRYHDNSSGFLQVPLKLNPVTGRRLDRRLDYRCD